MNFTLPHRARPSLEKMLEMLERLGADPDDARPVIEDLGWAIEQPVTEMERWINENGGGDTEGLETRVAALEVEVTGVDGMVMTLRTDVDNTMMTLGFVQGDVMVLGGRVDTIDVDLTDILNNLIPNTIRVGTVEAIGATSITVRFNSEEAVEATEWFVPVTPILGERIVVGRSGDNWVIVSTFEVEPPLWDSPPPRSRF